MAESDISTSSSGERQEPLSSTQGWLIFIGLTLAISTNLFSLLTGHFHPNVIDFDAQTLRFFSFATVVQSLPVKVFMWLYVLIGIAWLYAAARFLRFLARCEGQVPWLVLICSSVVWMVIFATIFGDGYSEVAKHAHLSYGFFQVLLFVLFAGWPLALARKPPIA